MNKYFLILACILVLPVSSAFGADAGSSAGAELTPEEQSARAFGVFQQIYKVTEEEERAKALPQIEALYQEIITKYPKASIVHESYWRLMAIHLHEHNPPRFDKAETLYHEFVGRYPDSQTRELLADTLTKSYHSGAQWERLIRFLTPEVKKFIGTGSLARPQEMFFYAEAKFHLGDLVEAEKGYKIVASLFPGSKEAETARERLQEVAKRKTKAP